MTETQPTNRERLDKAVTNLGTMLDYLGLKASVKGDEKDGKLLLTVFSEDAGRIIGRKGQTLNCLLLLLNRMLQRNDPDCRNFHIDVDGYERKGRRDRDRRPADQGGPAVPPAADNETEDEVAPPGNRRDEPPPETGFRTDDRREGQGGRGRDRRGGRDRGDRGDRGRARGGRGRDFGPRREGRPERPRFDEERLRQQALDAAKDVRRWGDDITLPPMGPRERRVIHLTLQDDPEVASASIKCDHGDLKQVVVSLKKKG